jgi:hypothetical protein
MKSMSWVLRGLGLPLLCASWAAAQQAVHPLAPDAGHAAAPAPAANDAAPCGFVTRTIEAPVRAVIAYLAGNPDGRSLRDRGCAMIREQLGALQLPLEAIRERAPALYPDSTTEVCADAVNEYRCQTRGNYHDARWSYFPCDLGECNRRHLSPDGNEDCNSGTPTSRCLRTETRQVPNPRRDEAFQFGLDLGDAYLSAARMCGLAAAHRFSEAEAASGAILALLRHALNEQLPRLQPEICRLHQP